MNFERFGIQKIYCVNLDRRPDRMSHFQFQADEVGLEFERVSAVDGLTLDLPQAFKPFWGAVGCRLSHKKIMEQALQEGHERIFIFEDDCSFGGRFQEVLEFLGALPEWDWCNLSRDKIEGVVPGVVDSCDQVLNTHAYGLSRRFMQLLVAALDGPPPADETVHVDRLIVQTAKANGIRCFVPTSEIRQNYALESDNVWGFPGSPIACADAVSHCLVRGGKSIFYRPIPKNACTFMKDVMLRELRSLREAELDVHKTFDFRFGPYLYNPGPMPDAEIRFVVVRDPVDRFVSAVADCFSGRKEGIDMRIDSLSEVIERFLTLNRIVNVRHHFSPQTYYCGHEKRAYTDILWLSDLPAFVKRVFPASAGRTPLNVSSERRAMLESQLTPEIRRWIKIRYLEDYEFLRRCRPSLKLA